LTGSSCATAPRVGLRLVLFAAAWTWLALSRVAFAQSPGVYFEWQRPVGSGCPPQAVIEQDVESMLGRSVFTSAQQARLHVRGSVEEGAGEVSVRLDARTADGTPLGTRELHARSEDCAQLRNSVGLVLTLLAERDAGAAEPSLQLEGGVWAGSLFNVLPRGIVAVGPALALQLDASVQLRLDAAYWLPIPFRSEYGGRGQLQGASAALRLCKRLVGGEASVFDLGLCGGVQLGVLSVAQTRPEPRASQLRLLAHAVVELRGALRLGRALRLEPAVAPIFAFNRPSVYSVRDDGTREFLYRFPDLGVILSLAFII